MSSPTANNLNNDSNRSTNTIINLPEFCTFYVPDFTPLGGSRPDAAVVASTAVWMEEEKDAKEDVILPPDVLDTSLAMLCAPLTVTHAKDLRGREAHFGCPAVTVRLRNTDVEVMEALKGISANTPGGWAVGDGIVG